MNEYNIHCAKQRAASREAWDTLSCHRVLDQGPCRRGALCGILRCAAADQAAGNLQIAPHPRRIGAEGGRAEFGVFGAERLRQCAPGFRGRSHPGQRGGDGRALFGLARVARRPEHDPEDGSGGRPGRSRAPATRAATHTTPSQSMGARIHLESPCAGPGRRRDFPGSMLMWASLTQFVGTAKRSGAGRHWIRGTPLLFRRRFLTGCAWPYRIWRRALQPSGQ